MLTFDKLHKFANYVASGKKIPDDIVVEGITYSLDLNESDDFVSYYKDMFEDTVIVVNHKNGIVDFYDSFDNDEIDFY